MEAVVRDLLRGDIVSDRCSVDWDSRARIRSLRSWQFALLNAGTSRFGVVMLARFVEAKCLTSSTASSLDCLREMSSDGHTRDTGGRAHRSDAADRRRARPRTEV